MWKLLEVKLLSFKNRIAALTFTGELKFALGILTSIFFLWLLYVGSYRLLVYVQALPIIGSLLMLKFFAIALLTTFVMVLFSSLINSFSTIYSSRDLDFLLSCPVPFTDVFLFKTIEVTIQSSWMIIIALIPFFIAFAQIKSAGMDFFIALILLSIPFLFISTAVGVIISLLIMYFSPSNRTKDIVLVLTIVLGSSAYILFRFLEPEKLSNPDAFFSAMQYIAYLNAPIAEYLPSGWFTQALNSLLIKRTYPFLLNASYLMITAAILIYIIIFLSSKFYFSSWAAGQIGGIRSFTRRKEPKKIKFTRPVFINRILNALISKDLKLFFRDTKQWSQVLLVIALTIVYIFSICKLPMRISGDKESAHRYLSDFIGFFNIGGTGFILAALSLRFVFPQVSLERGSIWLILSSPINIKTFIFEKMLISTLLITSLGVILVVITNMLLGVTQPVFWFSIFTIVVISIGLCSLSTGIGSIYPKFNIENIAQLETSYGGIVCILCSLLYIGLTLAIEARAIQMFIRQVYTHQTHINTLHILRYCGIDLLLLNIVVIFFPLWAGIRSIKKYELRVMY